MLKQLLLTLTMVSLFYLSHAQQGKFELGFQGGVNISSAYGKGIVKDISEGLTGISIGGQVKVNTSAHFGIKALLIYDEYGWAYRFLKFESNLYDSTTTDLLYKLKYLNLPVMAEYSFGKKVKIHLAGGAFVGVLLSNKTVEKINGNGSANQQIVMNGSPHYSNKINLGFTAGTGVEIPLSSKMLIDINVRNTTGLTNVNGANSFKTTAFTFLGGLIFKV